VAAKHRCRDAVLGGRFGSEADIMVGIGFIPSFQSHHLHHCFSHGNQRGNPHLVCAVMGHKAVHLAHHVDRHFLALPLLALDKNALATATQDQVDAAIGATQAGFLNRVALPAESFADQPLEVVPSHRSEAFEVGTGVEQVPAVARFEERHRRRKGAQRQRHPGERCQEIRLACKGLRKRTFPACEPSRHAVTDGCESDDSECQGDRPRHGREIIHGAASSAWH